MSHQPAVLVLASIVSFMYPAAHADETALKLKDGTGREVVSARCSICHSLDYISMNAPVMTPTKWESTIRKMIDRFGAPIDAASAEEIRKYLSTQYAQAPG